MILKTHSYSPPVFCFTTRPSEQNHLMIGIQATRVKVNTCFSLVSVPVIDRAYTMPLPPRQHGRFCSGELQAWSGFKTHDFPTVGQRLFRFDTRVSLEQMHTSVHLTLQFFFSLTSSWCQVGNQRPRSVNKMSNLFITSYLQLVSGPMRCLELKNLHKRSDKQQKRIYSFIRVCRITRVFAGYLHIQKIS